jgi:hypothetical protein
MGIGPLKSPASLKGHAGKSDMSNTGESLVTISRVNIDILPTKRRDSMNDGLVQKNEPRLLDASSKLDIQCNISQVEEERLQDNTKSSVQPENLIPMQSSDDGNGEGNEAVKPSQHLNKDPKPKDQVSDLHGNGFQRKRGLEVWLQRCGSALVCYVKKIVILFTSLNSEGYFHHLEKQTKTKNNTGPNSHAPFFLTPNSWQHLSLWICLL